MSKYQPHRCDFCTGTVQPIVAKTEPIHVRGGLVLLDGVVIGKCDRCGHCYFPAEIVKRAERAAENPQEASQVRTFPVVAA